MVNVTNVTVNNTLPRPTQPVHTGATDATSTPNRSPLLAEVSYAAQRNAENEICNAMEARDLEALTSSIKRAEEVGVCEDTLRMAKLHLQQLRVLLSLPPPKAPSAVSPLPAMPPAASLGSLTLVKPLPNNPHFNIDPAKWCVYPEQLKEFNEMVEMHWPLKDPSVFEVVDTLFKPSGAIMSYALQNNPNSTEKAVNFATHMWLEGAKEFYFNISKAHLKGPTWICFLANPQAWEPEFLGQLLGHNPYKSPFAKALCGAERFIALLRRLR